MSDSDYYLTGLLTCPHCGQRYIGTSANGRTRYGKHATCPAPRLPADDLDRLVLQALYDFYTTAEPVLTAMIERAQTQRDTAGDDQRAELTALAHQITTTEAAIARYHTAFENGTMDDTTAGPRIRELRQRLAQLHTRHAELDAGPATPARAARPRHHHHDPRPPRHDHDQRHRRRTQGRRRSPHRGSPTHRPGNHPPSSRSPRTRWCPRPTRTGAPTINHRFAQWCGRWAARDSNPEPMD
ncbi:zinc ribbon domain-containing protein [Micromonospora sp. NBS 11-29]|uniref:zinc ribbon domain-containing protein n=1 Tax=Micromonospora sp. NBS 11-29 TaxID=1960879 RepID=UPI0034E8BD74